MKRFLNILFALAMTLVCQAQEDTTLVSHRADGRLENTYAVVHQMLHKTQPKWAFKKGMTKKEFSKWKKGLRKGMAEIMKWPAVTGQPKPLCVNSERKEEWIEETWECYPMEGVVETFLVLRPLKATNEPLPALLCIPGSGQTMRDLKRGMARDYVREGWIAVCVDNAAAGDQADQENKYPDSWDYDYELSSRLLLELGWSWLGYTSFLNYQVLQWMKTEKSIRRDRIVVSGFSLGTEPMMVIGVMDDDIYAFVYNDFLCNTQERALSMTAIDEKGRRHFPNSIRHLIPDYWHMFNFADVCCALAPRPLIFTEGGLDREFNLVRSAYASSGSPDAVTCYHYARFQDPAARVDRQSLPEGLTMAEYLPMVNVDPGHHYFKRDYILPWLRELLK